MIGAGPAGLFAACELLRHGVRPRIVERRLGPHGEARGTALQPATLEMLWRAGLAEPFLRSGVRIRHKQLLGPGLREIASEHFADAGSTDGFQFSLPQWRTEAILRDHPSSLGLEVEFGTEVTSIEADSAAVRVALETGGRRVTFISYDDSYSPPKAVEQVRCLVEQVVLACLSNTLGAASNSATVKFRQSEESATSLRRQWCGQVGRLQIASMEDRLAD